ncbi:MAG: peroxiredoxin [Pseudomonadota bacterium]
MMIKIGDTLPDTQVPARVGGEMGSLSMGTLYADTTAILLGVPAAFSPTCSNQHIPGFIAQRESLREKGVGAIICVSVNDLFVMEGWQQALSADALTFFPDAEGTFTRAIGMEIDIGRLGLGRRSTRYTLVAKNGIVSFLQIEEDPSQCSVSDVSQVMTTLAA